MNALHDMRFGLIDNWLRNVQDVRNKHRGLLDAVAEGEVREDRLCELNVIEQAMNVCETTVIRDAWARGQQVRVHGWIYGLKDGLMHDLGITIDCPADASVRYDAALKALEA